MYSRNHAAISALLAVPILLAHEPPAHPVLVAVVVVAVGVGIDFDHFLIAWLNTGSTRSVRRVLANPRLAFVDQGAIFDVDEVTREQRLLSHALIGGTVTGALCFAAPYWSSATYWAVVVAVTLYVHVVADLYADVRAPPRHAAPSETDPLE